MQQKISSTDKKAPNLTGSFPNGQVDAGSWLGAKNALYYCAQLANSISWVLFVSSNTTAIVSPYLSGSFAKVVLARETSKSETKDLLMSWKNILHATNSSISICTEKILFLTNNKAL